MGKRFWGFGTHCYATKRDHENQIRVVFWVFIWVVSWLVVKFAILWHFLTHPVWKALGVLITTTIGYYMIQAYRRFFREADELLRKIELEALALAAGVGLVGGMAFRLLHEAAVLYYEDTFNVAFVLISMTYAAAVVFGHRRYA